MIKTFFFSSIVTILNDLPFTNSLEPFIFSKERKGIGKEKEKEKT